MTNMSSWQAWRHQMPVPLSMAVALPQKMRHCLPLALLLPFSFPCGCIPASAQLLQNNAQTSEITCHVVPSYLSLFACHTCPPPSALLCFFKCNPALLFSPFSEGWEALMHSLVETNIRGDLHIVEGFFFPTKHFNFYLLGFR